MSATALRLDGRPPAGRKIRPVLITGGAGFIGCNLAAALARKGEDVIILDNLSRPGSEKNVEWLQSKYKAKISFVVGDVRERSCASVVDEARAVVHLAAQVAVTTSILAPVEDLDVNLCGTLNLLEAARARKAPPPMLFASTNKVYGDLGGLALAHDGRAYQPVDADVRANGIDESQPLGFHTPYGCSKGAADQYVLDYARTYRLPTAVFRMSCIYGPHQSGTEDQGWVAHFLIAAMRRKAVTVYGDGRQVRNLLYVEDVVGAYTAALHNFDRVQGRAFNVGGGPSNAVSVVQVLGHIKELLGYSVDISFAGWRPGDQRYYVSDSRRLKAALALPEPRDWRTGIAQMAQWFSSHLTATSADERSFAAAVSP